MDIGVLLYHHVNELDAVAAYAVFSAARRLLAADELEEQPRIEVATVARSRFSVQTSGGVTITPGWAFASAPDFEVLLVPGGPGLDRAAKDPAMRSFFATRVPAIPLVASVASGSLLLGAMGMLEGLEVTGHPDTRERLQALGDVTVVDRPVAKTDRIWSARSALDGIDVALEIVADRLGDDVRTQVERLLSLPPDRSA